MEAKADRGGVWLVISGRPFVIFLAYSLLRLSTQGDNIHKKCYF